jgi:hypothetical protein
VWLGLGSSEHWRARPASARFAIQAGTYVFLKKGVNLLHRICISTNASLALRERDGLYALIM